MLLKPINSKDLSNLLSLYKILWFFYYFPYNNILFTYILIKKFLKCIYYSLQYNNQDKLVFIHKINILNLILSEIYRINIIIFQYLIIFLIFIFLLINLWPNDFFFRWILFW